jgi:hypothetical protein
MGGSPCDRVASGRLNLPDVPENVPAGLDALCVRNAN